MPLLECLLAAALFGASMPASKALLEPMGPVMLAGLLYLGAAAATMPWAWRDRRLVARADRRNLLLLGGAVLFGGGLGPVLLLVGLARAPAASVALWLNLETVATIVLAWAIFREHVHGRTWIAGALVFGASVLLAAPSGFGLGVAGLLVGLACLCWGLDNNLTAMIDRFTPAQTTFTKGLVAGTVNVALGLALDQGWPGVGVTLGALVLGLFSYGLSLVLYIGGAQQLGATRSQMIFATAPFWGVLFAWTLLLEPLTAMQGVAAGLMALALWLNYTERHAHEHTHGPTIHTHLHRHDDGHHDHAHTDLPHQAWHSHEHPHRPATHTHPHRPDLHHRHEHGPPNHQGSYMPPRH